MVKESIILVDNFIHRMTNNRIGVSAKNLVYLNLFESHIFIFNLSSADANLCPVGVFLRNLQSNI